jgi:hypothetical protein
MSGTFPGTPALEGIKMKSVTPTMVSFSHNLRRQARSLGSQLWYIEGNLPPMYRSEAAPIYAFLMAQRGQYETFNIVLPGLGSSRGVATGTPLVKGASQTGRSVLTDGWTATQTNIVRAGDFIKFAGHNKVYMITADTNSNGFGEATITVEPALVASPADNAVVTVNNVPFTVANVDDGLDISLDAIMYGLKLSFVEVPD